MIERLRALRDRPLDQEVAKAVTLLGISAALGLFVVVALAGVGGGASSATVAVHPHPGGPRTIRAADHAAAEIPAQDPQDRKGTAAHRRAAAELAAHRALQHVPFTDGGASIELVGAQGGRALLRVKATTVPAGRRAWRAFLARFHDPGTAYVPIFKANRIRRES